MSVLFKVVSLLLQYPDERLLAGRGELSAALAALPESRSRSEVERFLAGFHGPLAELQSRYVETFDFDRRASLHLTYHLYGDQRRRGLELVRLRRRLAELGLEPAGPDELPDYLPALLEAVALAGSEAEAILAEQRGPLELLRARLHDVGSPYGALVDAVCLPLPKLTARQEAEVRRIALEGPPSELVGLEPFAAPEAALAGAGDVA